MEFEVIIGLEIHVQLKTKSKMFCTCDNSGENQPANTCICPVCLGHPGTLPVANKQAIAWSALASLALNCTINDYSKFDRKHYYYPDLPKAYQISQFDQPIGTAGWLYIFDQETSSEEKIRINRLHLEEDAAKLFHQDKKQGSLVDYNRGGTPLMEIVTEPDIKNPAQAKLFLQELRQIMRYLDVSEADMEKGHLRCDANISLRPKGEDKLYPKTEIKNLNSFKMVEKALEYEISRQNKLWLEGNPPMILTTRGWNDAKGITEEQRTKEEAHDYRYFPEPDLPPIHFQFGDNTNCSEQEIAIDINCIKPELPELPADKRKRFIAEYGLSYDDVKILTEDKNRANYAEEVFSELAEWMGHLDKATDKKNLWEENKTGLIKLASNWLINKLFPILDQQNLQITELKMTRENFAELIALLFAKKINSTAATEILTDMLQSGADPSHIIKDKNLGQISDGKELETIINQVIIDNPVPVADYKKGKEKALQSLVGKVMAQTKGKANPETTLEIFKQKLS